MVQDSPSRISESATGKKPASYWRWLIAPMLLLSLALHGVVLFVPVGPSDEDLVPPPDPEEDGIAITRVDPPRSRPASEVPADSVAARRNPAPQRAIAARPQQAIQPRARVQPQTQAVSRSRPASRPAQSQPSASAPAQSDQAAAAAEPQGTAPIGVPDLSSDQTVENPNPTAPGVGAPATESSSTVAAATSAADESFEQYLQTFGTFSGATATPEAEAAELRNLWLDSFTEQGGDYAELAVQPFDDVEPLPYQPNICLPADPIPAKVLVMVESDGTVNSDKQFLQTTGYRIFDRAARERLESFDFPASDMPQPYLVDIEVDYDSEGCEWPPNAGKLPQDYFTVLADYVGPELTTIADANAAREAWLQQLGQANNPELPQTDALTATEFDGFDPEVEYPLGICLPIEPKDAQWGVVVNPDGTINGDPQPLRSTGYSRFDQRSKILVESFDFPETEDTQIYVVEVPVAYNGTSCKGPTSDEFRDSTDDARVAAASGPAGDRPSSQLPSLDIPAPSFAASNAPKPDFPISEFTSGRPDVSALQFGVLGGAFNVAASAARDVSDEAPQAQQPAPASQPQETLAFDPAQQTQLIEAGRQTVEADRVGGLNNSPELAAVSIDSGWPDDVDRSCFLAELNETGFTPVDAVADAIILSENFDFVATTISRLYRVEIFDADPYCGAPLFELKTDGVSQLFASTVPFGAGNSNTLVVLWPEDPRQ